VRQSRGSNPLNVIPTLNKKHAVKGFSRRIHSLPLIRQDIFNGRYAPKSEEWL
jgi:hypothetical protein